jgi:hypothetical protein
VQVKHVGQEPVVSFWLLRRAEIGYAFEPEYDVQSSVMKLTMYEEDPGSGEAPHVGGKELISVSVELERLRD